MSRRRKWRIQKDSWDFLSNLANRFFHPGFIFFLYDMNYITSQIMTSIPFLICSSEKDNIVISSYSSSGLSEAFMCNVRGVVNINVRRATDNFWRIFWYQTRKASRVLKQKQTHLYPPTPPPPPRSSMLTFNLWSPGYNPHAPPPRPENPGSSASILTQSEIFN